MTQSVAASGAPAYDRRRSRRRAAWRRRGTVLAFLSPWIAGFTIFFGYPLVMTAYYSFTHYDLLSPPHHQPAIYTHRDGTPYPKRERTGPAR